MKVLPLPVENPRAKLNSLVDEIRHRRQKRYLLIYLLCLATVTVIFQIELSALSAEIQEIRKEAPENASPAG